MATTNEKLGPSANTTVTDPHSPMQSTNEAEEVLTGRPWMYRARRIGLFKIPAYASPPVQLVMVALVCFLCPGMFNALSGLGGGGQFDATTANNSSVALYSVFSVVGFFAGTIANRLGIKWTLSFGGLGYFIYIASFLSYNRNQNGGFPIFAGALLGVCAGLLWTAQGAIMMSYPPEESKGRYISWFWMIFNLGAVLGSLIPLGQNIHSSAGAVNDGTYIGFMVLTFCGAALSWCLVDARHVQRADGSHVVLMKHPTWQSELLGLLETLKTDRWVVFLFPMFFASNWFYTYQFNDVNSARFNIRTRALNGLLYWSSQILGALLFGYALDVSRIRRSVRAKAAWAVLFVITMAIWGGGYAWQKQYTRADTSAKDAPRIDWTASGYVGPMFLYMFYGFYDAAWQTCVYWFMGALTNNGRKLANFAGFYKGIQSAGAVVIFRIDALKAPFMNEFASCWGLLAGALLIALPLILVKVRDTVPLEDDVKFSDETIEEVMPTVGQETHTHDSKVQ
ncbi:MAG: hypothetical protein LQ350_005916 [Teloschistes chrysophthalmus]|nr:MAG: hypothetical protein LQ350_005916 [Niorma chrysophthalma]